MHKFTTMTAAPTCASPCSRLRQLQASTEQHCIQLFTTVAWIDCQTRRDLGSFNMKSESLHERENYGHQRVGGPQNHRLLTYTRSRYTRARAIPINRSMTQLQRLLSNAGGCSERMREGAGQPGEHCTANSPTAFWSRRITCVVIAWGNCVQGYMTNIKSLMQVR